MAKNKNKEDVVMTILKGIDFEVLDHDEGNARHIRIDHGGRKIEVWPSTGTVKFNGDFYKKQTGIQWLRLNFQKRRTSDKKRIDNLESRVLELEEQLIEALHLIEIK